MKDTYKITIVYPPIDEKYAVKKEYCDINLLYSSNKMDILSKNITELRKGDFDKFTTKNLQLINEFIKSTNEATNTVDIENISK